MPESVLDVFNGDAFSTVSLTTSIMHMPYAPSILGAMNLFTPEGVSDTSVMVEEAEGLLNIIPVGRRGAPGAPAGRSRRKARIIAVPHLKLADEILAEDIQGKRVFGQTSVQAGESAVATVVNQRLAQHRQSHEVTHEYHRIGALNGYILDADGSTVLDLFTTFGVSEQSVAFAFGTATTDIQALIVDAKRKSQRALGGTAFTGFQAVCGERWWDAFVGHAIVRAAFDRWEEGRFLRDDLRVTGFMYAGVLWREYNAMISPPVLDGTETYFQDPDTARLFPVGAPGLYKAHYAPADYIEAVNTFGQAFYAKQERMDMDRGVELETQSNPLHLCHKPACLVKLTASSYP